MSVNERPSEVVVVVPSDADPQVGSYGRIEPGSGIVLERIDMVAGFDGMLWFEGNLYGAGNIVTYADKVYHAWGRMDAHYPTIAKTAAHNDEIVEVGTFDTKFGIVTVTDEAALAAWLCRPVERDDLLTTQLRHKELRELRSWSRTQLLTLPPAWREIASEAGLL